MRDRIGGDGRHDAARVPRATTPPGSSAERHQGGGTSDDGMAALLRSGALFAMEAGFNSITPICPGCELHRAGASLFDVAARAHQASLSAYAASDFARDSCQTRLLRTVTPIRRSLICVKTGPLPALRKRRPVAGEKLFTSHQSENGIIQSSASARARALCRRSRSDRDRVMAAHYRIRSR
jgi:hypothetical protein